MATIWPTFTVTGNPFPGVQRFFRNFTTFRKIPQPDGQRILLSLITINARARCTLSIPHALYHAASHTLDMQAKLPKDHPEAKAVPHQQARGIFARTTWTVQEGLPSATVV